MTTERSRLKRALVLAGGGARGAYEVGVLAYIYERLPRELIERAPIEIIAGTSVGAIHAAFLGAHAQLWKRGVPDLRRFWRELELQRTLKLGTREVLRLPVELRNVFFPGAVPGGVFLNSRHLQEIVVRSIPWAQIRRNIHAGLLRAVSVSTTEIGSGRTVVFVDRQGGGVPEWSRDPRVVARAARIGPAHALASAAIPFLFPPIRVNGRYFSDGSLRQTTPLSPALRLGADRVLVVGLRGPVEAAPHAREENAPGAFVLAGKLLNALLLDRLDYDLRRLEGFNTLLRDGEAAYGSEFIERLHATTLRFRHQPYRIVDTLTINPTEDVGRMATEFIDRKHPTLGGTPGWILSRLGSLAAVNQSDVLSYLLFDGRFAEELIEVGYADAAARHDELIAFFSDAELSSA